MIKTIYLLSPFLSGEYWAIHFYPYHWRYTQSQWNPKSCRWCWVSSYLWGHGRPLVVQNLSTRPRAPGYSSWVCQQCQVTCEESRGLWGWLNPNVLHSLMVASLSSGFFEIYTRNKNSSLFASRWYFFLELGSFCGPDPRFQVFRCNIIVSQISSNTSDHWAKEPSSWRIWPFLTHWVHWVALDLGDSTCEEFSPSIFLSCLMILQQKHI